MQEFALRGNRDPDVKKISDQMISYWREGIERMVRPINTVQSGLAELTPEAARFTTLMMDAHRAPAAGQQLG